MPDLKQVGFWTASVAMIALIGYGKYKLAVAKPTLVILFLGGLVFALTSPTEASTQ